LHCKVRKLAKSDLGGGAIKAIWLACALALGTFFSATDTATAQVARNVGEFAASGNSFVIERVAAAVTARRTAQPDWRPVDLMVAFTSTSRDRAVSATLETWH
jgi:hypothetical protein